MRGHSDEPQVVADVAHRVGPVRDHGSVRLLESPAPQRGANVCTRKRFAVSRGVDDGTATGVSVSGTDDDNPVGIAGKFSRASATGARRVPAGVSDVRVGE